jgi:hypothetical protein
VGTGPKCDRYDPVAIALGTDLIGMVAGDTRAAVAASVDKLIATLSATNKLLLAPTRSCG